MPQTISHYHIAKEIGAGGAATVYFGVDRWDGKAVAIKIPDINQFRDEAARTNFIREANLYLYLKHPNIVSLHDFIIEREGKKNFYLIMEYVEGKTLDNYISNLTGPIPNDKAIQLFRQVLKAMAYAHQKGNLHRDIKPSNIMIRNDGVVKVLDFGISIPLSEKKRNNAVIGTPMYMSPEQVDAKQLDRRSDIYSLGVTLYQMLTGSLPYDSNLTLDDLFTLIRTKPLPRAKSIYAGVSDKMQEIIDKATDKKPDKRFQTCEEFEFFLLKAATNAVK